VKLNPIHVGVRDLQAALDWLDHIWQIQRQFRNERMATVSQGVA
jgi:hypothetical protein